MSIFSRHCYGLALAAALAPAASLAAQTAGQTIPNPQFGAAAGISVPAGGFAKNLVPGFNLSGMAEFRGANSPLGIRGELLYQYFGRKKDVAGAGSNHSEAAVVSVLYHVPGTQVRPYFIGGMGLYAIQGLGSNAGLNFGTGVSIPLTNIGAYAEIRVHTALTQGASYVTVPLSFGITF